MIVQSKESGEIKVRIEGKMTNGRNFSNALAIIEGNLSMLKPGLCKLMKIKIMVTYLCV